MSICYHLAGVICDNCRWAHTHPTPYNPYNYPYLEISRLETVLAERDKIIKELKDNNELLVKDNVTLKEIIVVYARRLYAVANAKKK